MQYVMEVLAGEIKQIETDIKELMKAEEALQTNYKLALGVTGIGFATSVHLLIATEILPASMMQEN